MRHRFDVSVRQTTCRRTREHVPARRGHTQNPPPPRPDVAPWLSALSQSHGSRRAHRRASNGVVALSALGSGRACPTTAVIAFCPSADARRFHSASYVQRSALAPAPAIRAGCLGSTGLCVHPGQWSLPSCAAWTHRRGGGVRCRGWAKNESTTGDKKYCPPPPLRKHGRNPKNPGKPAVKCHPPVAETRPCVRTTHTQQQSAVAAPRVAMLAGHHNKPHGVVMCGAMW